MGNKFSRRRDAPVSSAASAASEQKPAVEHSTPKPAVGSGIKQEDAKAENLDVLIEEPTKEECASEVKGEESPALAQREDAESELLTLETQAPKEPNPLVSDASPPKPESSSKPNPEATNEAEAQVALNPVDVSEQESVLQSEADTESIPQPVPTAAEAAVQSKDQEPLTDPVLSAPPLIDFGVPDVISSPATILFDPDESSKCSASEESSTAEPAKFTSDFLEKCTGVEAEECLKTLESDVNVENISELLKASELKENDLLSDIVPREDKIHDDTPITDMSTSMELK